jgi:MoxR-like ATPase
MRGRDYVLPQDVLDLAVDVLAHRMVLSYDAVADGVPAAHAVRRILQSVPLPQVAPRQRADGPMVAGPPYGGQQPGAPGQPRLGYGPAQAHQPPWGGERSA